jgi:hypothetical protein
VLMRSRLPIQARLVCRPLAETPSSVASATGDLAQATALSIRGSCCGPDGSGGLDTGPAGIPPV